MVLAQLPERGSDDWGQGHYGAPRGNRTHRGIDFHTIPGMGITSPLMGTVTKIGWPYANEKFRYVQITDHLGRHHRFFYVYPNVKKGASVAIGQVMGFAQDIAEKYNSRDIVKEGKRGPMKNHIHYEIKEAGSFIDPNTVYDKE